MHIEFKLEEYVELKEMKKLIFITISLLIAFPSWATSTIDLIVVCIPRKTDKDSTAIRIRIPF